MYSSNFKIEKINISPNVLIVANDIYIDMDSVYQMLNYKKNAVSAYQSLLRISKKAIDISKSIKLNEQNAFRNLKMTDNLDLKSFHINIKIMEYLILTSIVKFEKKLQLISLVRDIENEFSKNENEINSNLILKSDYNIIKGAISSEIPTLKIKRKRPRVRVLKIK